MYNYVDFSVRILKSLIGKLEEGDEVLLIVDGAEYLTSTEATKIIEEMYSRNLK